MSKEKRMLGNYEITRSIYIGDKEVVFGVDTKDPHPFMVCYCDYHNPLSAAWPTEGVASDDYLEAMQIFVDRVQSQIDRTKEELSKFPFDKTVFTKEHCIPDDGMRNIVGKVVVITSEPKRYEYQHQNLDFHLYRAGLDCSFVSHVFVPRGLFANQSFYGDFILLIYFVWFCLNHHQWC